MTDTPTVERELEDGLGFIPTVLAIWSTYRRNFLGIVIVTMAWSVPLVLLTVVLQLLSKSTLPFVEFLAEEFPTLSLLPLFLWIWAIAGAMAAIAHGATERFAERPVTIPQVLRASLRKAVEVAIHIVFLGILISLIGVAFSVALNILPDEIREASWHGMTVTRALTLPVVVFVGSRFIAVVPAVVEAHRRPFKRSWQLTKAQWIPIYGILLIGSAVTWASFALLGAFTEGRFERESIPSTLLTSLLLLALATFFITAAVVIHHRLRCLDEGLHLRHFVDIFS